jgi:putative CocE/NonD family hydrolase
MRRRDAVKSALGAALLAAKPFRSAAEPAALDVRVIENVFIPTPDGVKLAVQLWLPGDSDHRPAPVVLESIPYRKRDRYRAYGAFWGPTLARRGIGYARLDVRGSGDSTGVLLDEYLPSEQHDAATAIAWLAAQPWCNGSVGMRGVSWGGFSTLQTAALAPPALKAIMPMSASDMRYTDDAHYIGGAFALTGLKWATSMKVVMAGPPDPRITGDGWRAEWLQRLNAAPPIAARWLSHQTNDAYWRQGSVAVDLEAIRCPVYVVGGLVDSYGNEIPRLLSRLKVPKKGLYGPWQHGYPQPATPGPGLDWAVEEVRWWRHWLLREATGIMDEPMFRVYMPDATAAQVSPGPIPGRWIAERSWPSDRVTTRSLHPARGALTETPSGPEIATYVAKPVVGLDKVEWVPFAPTELPREQSSDDARSMTFDTPPLPASLEILGAPVLRARVSADRSVAKLAVRLCEVTSDGKSWLVTYGLLNLTHRDGHEHPRPLVPGQFVDVDIPLNFTAHRFQAGSRIRASLSESLWPLVWPSPEIVTLKLDLAASRLDLPVRAPPRLEAPMPIPSTAPFPSHPSDWPTMRITEDAGVARVVETWPGSVSEIAEIEETLSGAGPNVVLSMTEGDPSSCEWRARQTAGYRRTGWDVAVVAEVTVTATADAFHVEESTVAILNGETLSDRRHGETIARNLM